MKTFGVPRWLLAALALCAFIGGGLVWHSRKVAEALEQSYKRGWDAQKARSDAIIAKLDAENVKLVEQLRKKTDAQAVRIHVAAERERVLGPGRAAVRCPAAPAAAGGHVAPAASADDGGHRLPEDDRLAAVPWGWLVSRATQCDLDRNEVQAWRAWHTEVDKGFKAARSSSPAATR
jgi:hypothetical protein